MARSNFAEKFFLKYFGMNRFNFYGWIFTGSFLLIVSLVALFLGLVQVAIYLTLLGIFGVLVQAYLGMLAEKLLKEKAEDDSTAEPAKK